MLDFLLGQLITAVGDLLAGHWGWTWSERRQRRRTAAAVADGHDAFFPGWVLGRPGYCRAAGGLLVVTDDALYHVVDRGMPGTRHDVPTERLEIVTVRPGTRADHKHMRDDWSVMECLDGDEPVRIACHWLEMQHVERVFARSSSLPWSGRSAAPSEAERHPGA